MEISETHNSVWRVWAKGKVLPVAELKNTRERPWRVLKKKKKKNPGSEQLTRAGIP